MTLETRSYENWRPKYGQTIPQISQCGINISCLSDFSGSIKPLPKKATRNVTMAALLIEEVTRNLANE